MRQKIPLFDRKRGASAAPNTPSSLRMPWRTRRKEEPRKPSASQSEFNSIRVNTADYRSLDLLRQYDDDRINASSISQPASERDHRAHSSNTNELERYPSEDPNPRHERHTRRKPGECLFLTSGYRVNPKGSCSVKDLFSSTKDLSDGYEDGTLPFPDQSGEGFLLRGKWCFMILFLVLAFGAAVTLSWYLSRHDSIKKSSVHALVTVNPVAKLLGFLGGSDTLADARSMWINHVVKNDDNQILIAETFESRLNAEVTPLLEKYVSKIWDSASSSSFICHGGDQLMLAFSVTKAGSMPASITYETPCMSGPSSRSCVVKKQIADTRDLVVRLPSKSSRYMHAVHLEIDHTSKDDSNNSSEVRHIQDLGSISGQFRVELSDAARLALQRYCGQNKNAYSEDLVTEPVSERNTRLTNVYELKRLYTLLSNQSDPNVKRSKAWDTRMLSTVVIDPLEHSRHSLAPIHVQQLLSHLRGRDDVNALHTSYGSPAPHIAVSRPMERDQSTPSATSSPQPPEESKVAESTGSTAKVKKQPKMSSPSFNFQPPPTQLSTTEAKSVDHSLDDLHDDSNAEDEHRAASEQPSSPADDQESDDDENDTAEDTTKPDEEDKERGAGQEMPGAQTDTSHNSATAGSRSDPINKELPGLDSEDTKTSIHSESNGNDGAQTSDLSSGSVNSMSTARSPSVSREASSSHGSVLAQTTPSPDTRTPTKNTLVPSVTSHQFPSLGNGGYRKDPASARQFGVPTARQPDNLTAKSLESRPGIMGPSSAGPRQSGAGQALFAGSFTQGSNLSGQDSNVRSSLGDPRTQSLPSSLVGQLPPYNQRALPPPQIPSASTEQSLLASPGNQYGMKEPATSVSSVSPGVLKPFPQENGDAVLGAASQSSSTRGMLGSAPVRAREEAISQEGSPMSNGALVQPVPPRNVARTQTTIPNADQQTQNSLRVRSASGTILHQPVNAISHMNRGSRARPAD